MKPPPFPDNIRVYYTKLAGAKSSTFPNLAPSSDGAESRVTNCLAHTVILTIPSMALFVVCGGRHVVLDLHDQSSYCIAQRPAALLADHSAKTTLHPSTHWRILVSCLNRKPCRIGRDLLDHR
jgi:hypothetical protein